MKLILNDNSYYSDRILFDNTNFFKISNSILNYLFSIFYLAPKSYTDENIKTIKCFKNYLLDQIGETRLNKVQKKMHVNLDRMIEKGSIFTSRDLSKIVLGIKDVNYLDIQDLILDIGKNKKFAFLDTKLLSQLKCLKSIEDLNSKSFNKLYQLMQDPFKNTVEIKKIKTTISGRASKYIARVFYDPYLELKERLQVCENNHLLKDDGLYEKLIKNVIARVLEVGNIIKATSDKNNTPSYYRVKARLITARGLISYILVPATKQMSNIESVIFTKGSGLKPSSFDSLSYAYTDVEKELGQTAFQSGEKYEKYLQDLKIPTEVGFSIGGNIVQQRLCNSPWIKKIYLFSSTGITKRQLEKFNKRDVPIKVYSCRTIGDFVDLAGSYHIGYKNPRVALHCKTYRLLNNKSGISAHNIIFSETIEKFEVNNERFELNNLKRSKLENIRWSLGGFIIAPVLNIFIALERSIVSTNAAIHKGLFIEKKDDNGIITIEHKL